MTMTPSRDRLVEVRDRSRTARKERADVQRALDAAERVGDEQAVYALRAKLAGVGHELEVAGALESQLLSSMAGVSDGYALGDNWLDDPETIRELQSLAHGTRPIGTFNIGQIASADQFASMIQSGAWHQQKLAAPSPRVAPHGGGDGPTQFATPNSTPCLPDSARYGPWQGVVPQLRRRIRLLDLVAVSTMSTGAFMFFAQESGSLDTAAETPELQLKPGADVSLTSQMITIQTIAHWVKTSRQALDDVPGFGVELNNRLIYGVTRRIEQAILSGDGTGSNILGILNQPGLQSVAYAAGTPESSTASSRSGPSRLSRMPLCVIRPTSRRCCRRRRAAQVSASTRSARSSRRAM
jgi:hypothetical protein